MDHTFRIPPAPSLPLSGRLLTAVARRLWNQVPDGIGVHAHQPRVLRAVYGFERSVQGWKALDPTLTVLATMASASAIGCSWCLDFGYYLAHGNGLDESKVREVPRWRSSNVFDDLERDVMAHADNLSQTPPIIDDLMAASLLDRLGAPAMVELTQIIALENMRARFNLGAGLKPQGYAQVCELPLADADAASSSV